MIEVKTLGHERQKNGFSSPGSPGIFIDGELVFIAESVEFAAQIKHELEELS